MVDRPSLNLVVNLVVLVNDAEIDEIACANDEGALEDSDVYSVESVQKRQMSALWYWPRVYSTDLVCFGVFVFFVRLL